MIVTGSRYIGLGIYKYTSTVVEAFIYSDVVESLPVDPDNLGSIPRWDR